MEFIKPLITIIYIISTLIKGNLGYISKVDKDNLLSVHNTERADVGVGPLVWSQILESYATKLASKCTYTNDTSKSPYGENYGSPYRGDDGWAIARDWAQSRKNYDPIKNVCDQYHGCDMYKQMVWRKTRLIGCASNNCFFVKRSHYVCEYFPRGNIPGEHPY
ncbi:hypothetical protein vseg_020653 [Gypsophila vaccaria]